MFTRLIVLALWKFFLLEKFIMMNFLYWQAIFDNAKNNVLHVYFCLLLIIIFACYILHYGWNSFMYEFENDDYSLVLLIFILPSFLLLNFIHKKCKLTLLIILILLSFFLLM
jgi:hypothetical protein